MKDENKKLLDEKNEFYKGLFGMHASMTLSDKTLSKIKDSTMEGTKRQLAHAHTVPQRRDESVSIVNHKWLF
jgi:uncharacterized lipoprotein YehR (DUF1307 family)